MPPDTERPSSQRKEVQDSSEKKKGKIEINSRSRTGNVKQADRVIGSYQGARRIREVSDQGGAG